jgi:hypothetical protein
MKIFLTIMVSFITISFSTGIRAAQPANHVINADAARLSSGRTYIFTKSIMQIIFYQI